MGRSGRNHVLGIQRIGSISFSVEVLQLNRRRGDHMTRLRGWNVMLAAKGRREVAVVARL